MGREKKRFLEDTVKPILIYGSKKLRQRTEPIGLISSDFDQILRDMQEVLDETKGIGLAGNQIGVMKSIVLISLPTATKFFINPRIVNFTEETDEDYEACLSIPIPKENLPKISRAREIIVHYQDTNFNHHETKFDGLLSRILQHEIDHIHGILMIDKTTAEWKRKNKKWLRDVKNRKVDIPYSHKY